jgi:hypothetical protein
MKKPELKVGETYIGAIINADGTGNHIILLDGDVNEVTWRQAMEWAKELGGDLPNCVEQALLFSQHKDKFEERAYWSNTQHASGSNYAWCQHFFTGGQYYYFKYDELRARAVRRVAIGKGE